MTRGTTMEESIDRFAEAVAQNFAVSIAAHPEDQLKRPVQNLLENAGRHLGVDVGSRTEATVPEVAGRPDIGVSREKLLTGHVELKAPGKGARTAAFRGPDREQWQRFQALPNLIYTDGSEWALYRNGERQGQIVRLSADVTGSPSCSRRSVGFSATRFWKPFNARARRSARSPTTGAASSSRTPGMHSSPMPTRRR